MQLFSNNASSTLSGAISDTATAAYIQLDDAAEFASPTNLPYYEMLTITDGTNIEIVKCTWRSGNQLTIMRAQEGTTARSWNIGATVEARITKGTLLKFPQSGITGNNSVAISGSTSYAETVAGGIPFGTVPRTSNGNYVANSNKFLATQGADSYILECVKSGTTAASAPTFTGFSGFIADGTVVWKYAMVGTHSVSIGADSLAIATMGTAVGHNTKAGAVGTAIGYNCETVGYGGLAIGRYAKAVHDEAIAIGSSVHSVTNAALHISKLGFLGAYPDWMFGYEVGEYCGVASYLQSEPLDLAGGATWAATTVARHGTVVKPTTPNGRQYVRWCNNFDRWSAPLLEWYTPGSTDTAEPTWPTVFADSVTDGDGDWVCVPHDGSYVITLPLDTYMLVEEIGFIAYEASGITIQPTISIGTTGNLTKIANAQTTTGLTGNMTAWKYTLPQPVLVPDISIKIDTLATGTKLLGRFHLKGVLTKHWL